MDLTVFKRIGDSIYCGDQFIGVVVNSDEPDPLQWQRHLDRMREIGRESRRKFESHVFELIVDGKKASDSLSQLQEKFVQFGKAMKISEPQAKQPKRDWSKELRGKRPCRLFQ
jgi:hypothetical protein